MGLKHSLWCLTTHFTHLDLGQTDVCTQLRAPFVHASLFYKSTRYRILYRLLIFQLNACRLNFGGPAGSAAWALISASLALTRIHVCVWHVQPASYAKWLNNRWHKTRRAAVTRMSARLKWWMRSEQRDKQMISPFSNIFSSLHKSNQNLRCRCGQGCFNCRGMDFMSPVSPSSLLDAAALKFISLKKKKNEFLRSLCAL